MSKIINIEAAKPHITINGLKRVHVVPLSLIEDVAIGKIPLSDVDDADDFIPTLRKEWLDNL